MLVNTDLNSITVCSPGCARLSPALCTSLFNELTKQIHSYSRFDGPIHPMADLEMFFPMNFFYDSCSGVALERF